MSATVVTPINAPAVQRYNENALSNPSSEVLEGQLRASNISMEATNLELLLSLSRAGVDRHVAAAVKGVLLDTSP